MKNVAISLQVFCITLILWGGLQSIRDAIDRGNSLYLCVEATKLGLKPAECSKLLDHRP